MDNWYSDMREALVSVCQKNMLCNHPIKAQ